MDHIKCSVCEKPFLPTHRAAKFCSQACFRQYRKGKSFKPVTAVTKTCDVCGKEFTVPESQAERRRCCSQQCYYSWRRGRRMNYGERKCDRCGKTFAAQSGAARFCSTECLENSLILKCEHCGKDYAAKVSHGKRRKYCSNDCFYEARTAKALEDRVCQNCGTTFTVIHALRNRKFCSVQCSATYHKGQKKEMRGEYISSQGYRVMNRSGNPVLEHRHVLEQVLGRPLRPGENAHHKNGDRLDNRPENLELWLVPQPAGQRIEDRIESAIDLLESYGYVVTKHEGTASSVSEPTAAVP